MGKKSKKQKQTGNKSLNVENKTSEVISPESNTITTKVDAVATNTATETSTCAINESQVVQVEESKSINVEAKKMDSDRENQNKKKAANSNGTKGNLEKQPEVKDNIVFENTATTSVLATEEIKTEKIPTIEKNKEEEMKQEAGKKKRNKKKKSGQANETTQNKQSEIVTLNQVDVQITASQKEEIPINNQNCDMNEQKYEKESGCETKVNQDIACDSQIQRDPAVIEVESEPKVEAKSDQEINKDVEVAEVATVEEDKPNIIEEEEVPKRKCYSHGMLLQILKSITLIKPQLRCIELATSIPHKQPIVHERQQEQSQKSKWGNLPMDLNQRKAFLGMDHKNVVLHKSANSWQTTRKEVSKDEIDTLVQKMRGLLNKLSPENFDKILSDIKGMPFDSLGKLVGCIKVLFEKAVMEPGFSPTYARLALNMSNLSVEEGNKKVSFRTLLIRECQAEFEKDKTDEKFLNELTDRIRLAKTEEEKKAMTAEKQMAVFKAKRRSLGNIKFIGELFKMNILSEAIMITCINRLMQRPEDEENMECLCQLLSTIGKVLDSKSKDRVDALLNDFDKLVIKKTTSSRIRFMIMDVIDLRKSGWVPKKREIPTTIAQVHRDAEREKQRATTYDNRPSYKTNAKGPAGQYQNKMSATNSMFQDYLTSNMKQGKDVKKSIKDGGDIKKPKTDGKKFKNKFGLLRSLCADNDEDTPQRKKSLEQSPENKSAGIAEKSAKSVKRVEPEGPFETLPSDQKVMPRGEMELKVKSRIDEFLSLKDMNEALESIKELNTEACYTNAVRFFYISLSQNFEKSLEVRQQIGLLHRNVLEKRVAPVEAYVDALIKFSTFASDLVVDIPQVWTYISELVVPVTLDSELVKIDAFTRGSTFADAELDEDLSGEEGDYTAMLLAAILNGVSSTKGKEAAELLWAEAGLKWDSFLKHNNLEDFKKKFLIM